ncbi:dTDP-4-dehydrorhamnose 3,5-epimerase [Mariniflexile gromovii]|uniref:dTDP-4-dehydrorhamnose 3,5-epimerase n=1 Tax=Mariniflexile gromovii TaxID=362523 RepID=A0ABS4BSZ1_9FLAO|nr:dTDP-4-dehydrorhamnose 3,5-epimerase [Mariniflexile gromovii]MBP0903722.1 dTDP-4-dehydrorhamnose 3,5-epimerase [Mariniflexile gromovii]
MIFKETKLKGCFIIEPKVFSDNRGYFMESYNKEIFDSGIGEPVNFVQDNQSFSSRGVIRGLHYQIGNHAQAKLVRVLSGRVLDVAVDLRKGSPSFGEYVAVELSGQNKKQLYIPRGFAHGFAVLSETAEFFYKCDNYYNKESEGGILYNDSTLNINWELPLSEHLISEKDSVLPKFKDANL